MIYDRRKIGLVVSATMAALAGAIAALPLIQGDGGAGVDAPSLVPRPLVIGSLLAMPAVIGAIASIRGSGPLFIVAGVLGLFQSFIAFSGVTLGFVLPAVILISLGLRRSPTARPTKLGERVSGVLIAVAGIAAWIVPFVLAETRCWIARIGADGATVYQRVPVTDTMTLGPGISAGGCDGGVFTLEGLAIGAILAIGAVAMGWLASATSPATP
ncbi:MAG: hypothetical protein ACXW4L_00570 [Candidatus Limnocylindrales bacterium]